MREDILKKLERLIQSSTSIENLLKDIFEIIKELDEIYSMDILEKISSKVYKKIKQLGNSDELIKIKEELAKKNPGLNFYHFNNFMRSILYKILYDEEKLESIFFAKDSDLKRHEMNYYINDFNEVSDLYQSMHEMYGENILAVFIRPNELMKKYNLTEKEAKERAKTNIFNFMDSILEFGGYTFDLDGEMNTLFSLLTSKENILFADKKFVMEFITKTCKIICKLEDSWEFEDYLEDIFESISASVIVDMDFLNNLHKTISKYKKSFDVESFNVVINNRCKKELFVGMQEYLNSLKDKENFIIIKKGIKTVKESIIYLLDNDYFIVTFDEIIKFFKGLDGSICSEFFSDEDFIIDFLERLSELEELQEEKERKEFKKIKEFREHGYIVPYKKPTNYFLELIERIPASIIYDTDFLEKISCKFGNYDDVRDCIYIIDSMYKNSASSEYEELECLYSEIDDEKRFNAKVWFAIKKQYEKILCQKMSDSFKPSSYIELTEEEACAVARKEMEEVFKTIELDSSIGYFYSITIFDVLNCVTKLDYNDINNLFSNDDFTYKIIKYIYTNEFLNDNFFGGDKKEKWISFIVNNIKDNISFEMLKNEEFLDMIPESLRKGELKERYERYKSAELKQLRLKYLAREIDAKEYQFVLAKFQELDGNYYDNVN